MKELIFFTVMCAVVIYFVKKVADFFKDIVTDDVQKIPNYNAISENMTMCRKCGCLYPSPRGLHDSPSAKAAFWCSNRSSYCVPCLNKIWDEQEKNKHKKII